MTDYMGLIRTNRFILLGILIAFLFIIIDGIIETWLEDDGGTILISIFHPDTHTSIHRIISMALIIGFGILARVIEMKSRQVDRALEESRNNYLALADSIFSGIVIHRMGKIIEANDKFAKLFGYTKEELINISTLDLVSDESREIAKDMMDKEHETSYEVMGLRSDGSEFDMEVLSKNITFLDKPARISALRDISHIKNYESLMRIKQDSEDILLRMMTMFVGKEDIDEMINKALREFGEFCGACRIQVFELQDNGLKVDNTYEWCAFDYHPMMEGVCGIKFDNFYNEVNRIRNSKRLAGMPGFDPFLKRKDREMLEFVRYQGDSFVDIPLYLSSGFVGVLSIEFDDDQCKDRKEQTMMRQIFSEMLEIILERKRATS